MNITLPQLRSFLEVADKQHFRLAAEALHLSQPAVSRRIHELETQLGVPLFDRHTRVVVPTAIGAQLQGRIARLLDELDSTLEQARTLGEGRSGTVRVAAGPTPSAEVLPTCIARCAADYPDIHLLASDYSQQRVETAVKNGEVDLGVVIDPPDNADLVTETLCRDPFVLVCQPTHPLAEQEAVSWQALAGEPLILLNHASGSRRLIDAALAERGIEVRVVQETGHTHTAYRMVEAGLGATIQIGLSAPQNDRLVTRPLVPTVARDVTLIRRRDQALTPAAATVWEVIKAIQ